jgi:hypothetical protein
VSALELDLLWMPWSRARCLRDTWTGGRHGDSWWRTSKTVFVRGHNWSEDSKVCIYMPAEPLS